MIVCHLWLNEKMKNRKSLTRCQREHKGIKDHIDDAVLIIKSYGLIL